MWQRFLDKLTGGLVPFTALLEVLCGGDLCQSCYCSTEEVTVKDIYDLFMEVPAAFNGPVLLFSDGTSLSLCEKNERLDSCSIKSSQIFMQTTCVTSVVSTTRGSGGTCAQDA